MSNSFRWLWRAMLRRVCITSRHVANEIITTVTSSNDVNGVLCQCLLRAANWFESGCREGCPVMMIRYLAEMLGLPAAWISDYVCRFQKQLIYGF